MLSSAMRHLILPVTILCLLNVTSTSARAVAEGSVKKSTEKEIAKRNTVYLELGGIAAYYSLNYQRNIPVAKNFGLAAGIALAPVFTLSLHMHDPQWSP